MNLNGQAAAIEGLISEIKIACQHVISFAAGDNLGLEYGILQDCLDAEKLISKDWKLAIYFLLLGV
jgi:hypothetical protein